MIFGDAIVNNSGKKGKCKSCISNYMKKYTTSPERLIIRREYDFKRARDPKIKIIRRQQAKIRYKTDVSFKLRSNLSTYIWESFSKNKENNNLSKLLDFSINDLIIHLKLNDKSIKEKYLSGKLHVDHIRPVSSFNIKGIDCDDFKECWGLNNLQLLPKDINLKKTR